MQATKKPHFSSFVQDYNRRLISDALSALEGSIGIVWDEPIMKQLDNVVITPSALQAQNVTKNFWLKDSLSVNANVSHFVYLIAPTILSVDLLINNYMKKIANNDNRLHHVMMIPEVPFPLQERLKSDPKVWNKIESVKNLPLHWFPTEQPNFLHSAQPQLPSRMLIDGDWNVLFRSAMALLQLERLMPSIPTLYCKGKWSARIVEMIKGNRTVDEKQPVNERLDIEKVVIIDRWLDPLTPLMSQSTFGGVIDDLFSINIQGKVDIPQIHADQDSTNDEKSHKSIWLSNENNINVYEQLQDLHLSAVKTRIDEIDKEREEMKNQIKSLGSMAEYKKIVSRLQNVAKNTKALDVFAEILAAITTSRLDDFLIGRIKCEQEILLNMWSDKIVPFIENSIIEAYPWIAVLKLIALHSLVSNGLKPAILQTYRKLFIQSYGVNALSWWLKLQIAGLIRCSTPDTRLDVRYSPVDFVTMTKAFRLHFPDVDEIRRSDTAYAYSGRASLLVRYIEEGIRNDWKDFTKVDPAPMNKDIVTDMPLADNPFSSSLSFFSRSKAQKDSKPRTMVFVVGGVTRAEVSSLKLLSENICLIASTGNITGDYLLNSFNE